MADELKATPVKREWALKLADALRSGREYANKLELPFFGGAGDFVLGKTPEGLERVAYDEPLTSGSGWTTRLRPETVDMGFTALDVLPVGKVLAKGLRKGTEAASTAAVRGITGNPNATPIGVIDEIQRMNLLPSATVWHGSPHTFEKFDLSKIGTGEGAQAYGHGLYLAESPNVATEYSKMEGMVQPPPRRMFQGAELTPGTPEYHAGTLLERSTLPAARKEVAGWIKEAETWPAARKADPREMDVLAGWQKTLDTLNKTAKKSDFSIAPGGNLYKVDLPDEQIAKMLDWDKPLSEQAPEVLEAIKQSSAKYGATRNYAPIYSEEAAPYMRGQDFYRDLSNALSEGGVRRGSTALSGQDALASQHLNELGIPGIQYLDQASRGAGEGTRNYVVFSDEIPQILERNNQPVAQALRNYEAPKQSTLQDVVSPIEQRGVTLDVYESNKKPLMTLSRIEVPKEMRGQGVGTQAMQDLVNYANQQGKTIALSPSTDFGGTSVGRLKDFYKQFGFVENKGRNKDFEISESMYRLPETE